MKQTNFWNENVTYITFFNFNQLKKRQLVAANASTGCSPTTCSGGGTSCSPTTCSGGGTSCSPTTCSGE